jgi:hypothetical protein
MNFRLIQHLQQLLNSGQFMQQQQQPLAHHVVAGTGNPLDPLGHPDPLVRDMDPDPALDPDPSVIKQKE